MTSGEGRRSKSGSIAVAVLAILAVYFMLMVRNSPLPELGKNSHEILALLGFSSESHTIVTADGYQLELIRVVNPRRTDIRREFYPVLLLHGFQGSSNVWLVSGNDTLDSIPEAVPGTVPNSLAIALATANYDVWLGNVRGNLFSRQHTDMEPTSGQFWNFTIDDIVRYDLPAMINYVRGSTGREQIGYIGHSQANLMLFSLMSTVPEINKQIKPFIALAPTVFTTKFSAPMALSPLKRDILFGIFPNEFMPEFLRKLRIPVLCANGVIPKGICFRILHSFVGSLYSQVDQARVPVYLDNLFYGCATNQYKHRLQMIARGQPAYYNYSTEEQNLAVYGVPIPPLYDLSKIDNKYTAIIHTDNDWFNHEDDIQLLRDALKAPLFDDYRVPDHGWNHADLLWAKDTGKLVNSRILSILERSLRPEVDV